MLAVFGGVIRMGWNVPLSESSLSKYHGPLMITGFVGTILTLERAALLHKSWALIAPVITGAGSLLLVSGTYQTLSIVMISTGSLGLLLLLSIITFQKLPLFTIFVITGAIVWICGYYLWINGLPLSFVAYWWYSFLVITLSAQRIQHLRTISIRAKAIVLALIFILNSGVSITLIDLRHGIGIIGLSSILLMIWLISYETTWKRMLSSGIRLYRAMCLLSGYMWLGISGFIGLFSNAQTGPMHDAFLHSMFLGFVFSLLFGHVPVIFSAVIKFPLQYSKMFYLHLALLHITLLIRIIGDIFEWHIVTEYAGILNALVILIFLINTLHSIYFSRNLNFGGST